MDSVRQGIRMKNQKVDRTEYFRQLDRSRYYWERAVKKKYGNSKRICAKEGCSTILNSYNFNMCCSLHNFEYVKKHKLKIELKKE